MAKKYTHVAPYPLVVSKVFCKSLVGSEGNALSNHRLGTGHKCYQYSFPVFSFCIKFVENVENT